MHWVVLRMTRALVLGGVALFAAGLVGNNAQAQTIFCPTTVAGIGGTLSLQGGLCTNTGTVPIGTDSGAFSNAALAAQALSDVSQSASFESTQTALAAISARRRVEIERCPDGFERVNGNCVRIATPTPTATPAPTSSRRAARTTRRAATEAPVYKAPAMPMLAIDSGRRYAVWGRVFGDYERRTGISSYARGPATIAVASSSNATTWGLVAGADVTIRTSPGSPDGFIFGVLTGYIDSDVRLNVASTSSDLSVVGNASGSLIAHLRGPTLGMYATYFNGGFSTDLTFKADFLDVGVSFTDVQAFTGVSTIATFSSSGSTSLINYTTVGNVNYRIPMSGAYWIEPTAGFQYISADYSGGAAALGLADGQIFRIQGGARFGTDFMSGSTKITPVLTALAYDNVSVSGGFIQGGVFTTVPVGLADEGKLRGLGILALNFDGGQGVTGFIQGEVRGGDRLQGYGGKAGIRYQWGS